MISSKKEYLSDGMNMIVDTMAQKLIQASYERTKSLLLKYKSDLEKFSKELLVKETMSKEEVKQLLNMSV
jgi:cell division protease FtsH